MQLYNNKIKIKKSINKIAPPTSRMRFCKLKVLLNTIAICGPGDLVTLEDFNKYILPFLIKLKRSEMERKRSKILSGCGP